MNLSNVDLNLFLVLHTVLEEGSATAAARRLHVTQSAVSNALARLREALGDPLVVRSGRGLVPTPRARALRPVLEGAIAGLRGLVEGEAADPARRFTLACADHLEVACVPALVARFRARLPQATLRIVSKDYQASSNGLATGEIDAALSPEATVPPEMQSEPLFDDAPVVLVARRDHPVLRGRLTAARFNALDHVEVHVWLGGPGPGGQQADARLAAAGLRRRVALSMPHFTSAALVAARSDLVTLLPGSLARTLCRDLPLRSYALPVALPGLMRVCLVWHPSSDADPGSRLFREVVREALGRR